MSDSHKVIRTSDQNDDLQNKPIVISIRYHDTSDSTNRLGCDFYPGCNHRDRSVGHGHLGTGLQGKNAARGKQPSANGGQ